MPTYEYICRACGHEFEVFHSITAAAIAVCPTCKKKRVERKISGGGAVLFRGGGFYETDYRSANYKSGAESDRAAGTPKEDAAGKKDEKSGGTSEQKPAVKSESESKSQGKSDSKSESTRDAKPEAPSSPTSPPKADSKPSNPPTNAADHKRIDARATHPSRVGRGMGNIAQPKAARTPRKRGS